MFLKLNHQKSDVYMASRKFVLECYKLTRALPTDEKYGMIAQIRRAALSVHLNIAEGASRKSAAERRRYYEISRGSVIEIDAAMDVALDLSYLDNINTDALGESMISCFKMLTGLISSITNSNYRILHLHSPLPIRNSPFTIHHCPLTDHKNVK